jgi:transcriptional regulator with XRE-family HTH domain
LLDFALLQNDGNTIHLWQEVKIMVDKKTLGKIIQSKRKELGKTQSRLAEETDLSRNYISDIENGRYTPSIDSLTKIAVSLGLDLNVIKMTEIQVTND